MPPVYRVISMGTLAAHPLWNERGEVRTAHATTTLVSAGDVHVLVDPSLPARALAARMSERSPVRPEEITHVFLTTFQRERRRALEAFEEATWLLHEPERRAAGESLQDQHDEARDHGDAELLGLIDHERRILDRCADAPDSIAEGVDLFPLPGVTPGCCGLLLAQPSSTVLICGDAIATAEHLEQGMVLPRCVDHEAAMQSFREAVEIADVLVLGRDNAVPNPLRRML